MKKNVGLHHAVYGFLQDEIWYLQDIPGMDEVALAPATTFRNRVKTATTVTAIMALESTQDDRTNYIAQKYFWSLLARARPQTNIVFNWWNRRSCQVTCYIPYDGYNVLLFF